MKKLYFIAALPLILSACMPRTYVSQVPYSEAAFHRYDKSGTGKIYGQAFLTTNGGDVKKGAGRTVYLTPATAYTDEMYHANALGLQFQADPRLGERHIKHTVADADGNFEFDHLPPGDYYVETSITWEIPSDSFIPDITGSDIVKKVSIKKGESKKVLLTE